MDNNMDQANPEAEVINVVSAIADNERAKAIDAIQDLLYAKAADAMGTYKQSVAQTFFDEPTETEVTDETDNGTD
tara:strand:+ start:428 stop:652 length:225 start_codon:yes stop_codon:yes gene_type:complete